jgi:DNA repair exonuclease SbcCD nuclease subunit
MRFVHTADWQIGMKAAHVGDAGQRVREERLEAARRVVQKAKELDAEFMVVAGDTFEHNGIDRLLIQKTADILRGLGRPVFIIPGNHDPLVPGSVWEHPSWADAKNIHILRESAPVEIPGGVLLPCPAKEKYSSKDPTAWMPARSQDEIRIGLAHGTVENVALDEQDYPIPRDAAASRDLDYLALGHYHSFATFSAPGAPCRMAYSGTHEPTKFGERDSGGVLLVEISPGERAAKVTRHETGRLRWKTLEWELPANGPLDALRDRVSGLEPPDCMLLRVQLSGVFAPSDVEGLEHLRQIVGSRFLFGHVDDSRLRPSPIDDSWMERLPPGPIRDAAQRLGRYADPAFAGQRPADVSPDKAAAALRELFLLLARGEK